MRGPIARADLDALCAVVRSSIERDRPARARCDVRGAAADAGTVEALARVLLVARRLGCRIELVGTSRALRELIAFMGLSAVFAGADEARA